MGQLHQILAVEPDLVRQAEAILEEAKNTFTKKQEHFDGIQKVYSPWNEADAKVEPEIKEVVTTVGEKLKYVHASIAKALDATLSKEETNASDATSVSLIVDGRDFGKFHATSLIALEKNLVKLRDVYRNAPTLDPVKSWTLDPSSGRALNKTPVEVKYRTAKKQSVLTLSPATDKFPAQTQLITEDVQVGQYETIYISGRIPVAEKSRILGRIDRFILEVKKAREAANSAKVTHVTVAEAIFDHIIAEGD